MPPQTDRLQIDPYTTTVPMVQIPPSEMEGESRPAPPLQGQFGKKGTGALAIGDAMFKGFMMGHAEKAKRKYETAQATIAAADAATQAAYQKYQDSLVAAGGNVSDPTAKAAYDAYQGVFAQGKQAKAQFVIGDDQGGKKKTGEKGKDGKKAGFMGGIKDFFEANPHIVPQIALMTMQPKPAGIAAETQETLDRQKANKQVEAQNDQILTRQKEEDDARKTVSQYAGLTPEQITALPPDEQKKLKAAQYVMSLSQPAHAKYDVFKDPDGNEHYLLQGESVPPGWQQVQKQSASGGIKLGTVADFIDTTARDNKIGTDKFTAQQKGYLESMWHFFQTNPNAASATSWYVDDKGNWQTRTAPNYRGPVPPKPPAGVFPPNFIWPGTQAPAQSGTQAPTQGAITAPPARASAKPAAGGGMTAPPARGGGLPSWQRSQNTQKVETEKKDRYAKASAQYEGLVKSYQGMLSKGNISQQQYNQLVSDAKSRYDYETGQIEQWYTQQVHAVGGTVPSDSGFDFNAYPVAN